MDRSPVEQAD